MHDSSQSATRSAAPRTSGRGLVVHADFRVEDMACPHCSSFLEQRIRTAPGVRSASVDPAAQEASIDFDPTATRAADLIHLMQASGYSVRALALAIGSADIRREPRRDTQTR